MANIPFSGNNSKFPPLDFRFRRVCQYVKERGGLRAALKAARNESGLFCHGADGKPERPIEFALREHGRMVEVQAATEVRALRDGRPVEGVGAHVGQRTADAEAIARSWEIYGGVGIGKLVVEVPT